MAAVCNRVLGFDILKMGENTKIRKLGVHTCEYTTKKKVCTKGTKSGGTLVYILLKKKCTKGTKNGSSLVCILLKKINVRKVRKNGGAHLLYTIKIDYEEWSSVSQTSMCCLSEASNFTKRSVRE